MCVWETLNHTIWFFENKNKLNGGLNRPPVALSASIKIEQICSTHTFDPLHCIQQIANADLLQTPFRRLKSRLKRKSEVISVSPAVPIAFWKMPFYACFGELALNDLGVCVSLLQEQRATKYTHEEKGRKSLCLGNSIVWTFFALLSTTCKYWWWWWWSFSSNLQSHSVLRLLEKCEHLIFCF